MNSNFFAYIQQIELMAFFSGYPLVYAVILTIAGSLQQKNDLVRRTVSLLPISYALVGTLYLGLQLKNLYPDYSFEHFKYSFQLPFLVSWGLLSVLFWIPALIKIRVLSLIHSLVIFALLVKDLFIQISASPDDKDILRNAMKIYSISILLNLGAVILVTLIAQLFSRRKNHLQF
jgi:hypothetical protein